MDQTQGKDRGTTPGARAGLLVLAAAMSLSSLLGSVGCSQITTADDTKGVLEKIDDDAKKGRALQIQNIREFAKDPKASVAPKWRMAVGLPIIDYSSAKESKTDKDAKDKTAPSGKTPATSPAGKGGAAPAPAPKSGAMAPAAAPGDKQAMAPVHKQAVVRFRKASTNEMVALCYRTPLYRELLFSPPPGSPSAPEEGVDAAPAEMAQTGDTVEWLCPRCQRTVSDRDPSCRDCGLAFSAEEPQKQPKKPADETKADEVLVEKQPIKIDDGKTKPVADVVEVKPVETKWICSQCSKVVDTDQRYCDRCFVVLAYPDGTRPPKDDDGGDRLPDDVGGPKEGIEGEFKPVPGQSGIMVYFPDRDVLQGEILETCQAYLDPDFKAEKRSESQIVAIKVNTTKVEDMIAYCRSGDQSGDFFDYLLVPKVRKWTVTYLGQDTLRFVAALALWIGIGEPANGVGFPTAYIAAETFRTDVQMDFDLYHVRSGAKINTSQKDSFTAEKTCLVNQWDRGYYPWSIVLVPGATFFPRDKVWPEINNALSPHARNDIKKQLIDETLYKTFVKDLSSVKDLPPNPPAQEPQLVALLIANDNVDGSGQRLQRPARDIERMKQTLEGLGLHDGTKQDKRGNRYVTFEKETATALQVRTWLKTQLPRLAPQDTLMIYYSGFGVTQYEQSPKWPASTEADKWQKYLVLQDTDLKNLRGDTPTLNKYGAINVNEITEALNSANVANAFVVLDCSFGARAIDESIGVSRTLENPNNTKLNLETLLKDRENFEFMKWVGEMGKRKFSRGCLVFVACNQDEAAMEYDSLGDNGSGLLTYFFCEALTPLGPQRVLPADADRDGKVSTKELTAFVSARVYKQANVAFGVPQEVRIAGESVYWFRPTRAGAAPKKEEPVKKDEPAKKAEEKAGAPAAPPAPAKPDEKKPDEKKAPATPTKDEPKKADDKAAAKPEAAGSVPPGYMFHRGIVWNSAIYQAAIDEARKENREAACITKASSGDLYLVYENYRIVKVDSSVTYKDGTFLACAFYEPIQIGAITLTEGECALRKDGAFEKLERRIGGPSKAAPAAPAPGTPEKK